jgi:hypothetical protein
VKNASAFNTTIDCRFHIQIGTGRASVAWAAVLALGFLSLVISFIHFCHFSLFFLILKKIKLLLLLLLRTKCME